MASYRILMLHLDLGIGGAENLVVQIACTLQHMGHHVTIVTSHHDLNHCFEETKPSGPLGNHIKVYGDFLPRNLFGKFTAFFAILRMFLLAIMVVLFMSDYDFVFIDGVPAPIPLLRSCGMKVLYYCHFPDLLLCTDRSSALKKLYRVIMDKIEGIATEQSSLILVNSEFTAGVFKDTFPSVYSSNTPQVLYPVVNVIEVMDKNSPDLYRLAPYCRGYDHVFFSLNRYERKKRIEVAIDALAHIKAANPNRNEKIGLVIAGGYDVRVEENVEYLQELQTHCQSCGLRSLFLPPDADLSSLSSVATKYDVIFRISISSAERLALFALTRALIYTPDREHFGIVPIEAMLQETPVIAVNSGGPKESVLDGVTGFLCEQDGAAFGNAMLKVLEGRRQGSVYSQMGKQARERVLERFSDVAMQKRLSRFIQQIMSANS